jgi:hypothetical protein
VKIAMANLRCPRCGVPLQLYSTRCGGCGRDGALRRVLTDSPLLTRLLLWSATVAYLAWAYMRFFADD